MLLMVVLLGYREETVENFKGILSALDQHKVKATFFITTGNMSDENSAILDMAKEHGHQFGNHTHRHLNLNNVTPPDYSKDIDRCSELARKWINSKYFRYSYLRRGDTPEKRNYVLNHLQNRNMIVAPVTIDNNEWVYNRDYSKARNRNDAEEIDRQLKDYLQHMSEMSEKYRAMGVEIMDREVDHILLIHVNTINCDHLDKLLNQYKDEGWEFISLDEAMKDEFYLIQENYIGPHGISQLDRVKNWRQ